MSQNKHNFNYIKDSSQARSGDYYQKFELKMVIVSVMKVGMIAIMMRQRIELCYKAKSTYI